MVKQDNKKNALIDASDGIQCRFVLFKKNQQFIALDIIIYEDDNDTIIMGIYDTEQELFEKITWFDWIIAGIKNEVFKTKLINYLKSKKENV